MRRIRAFTLFSLSLIMLVLATSCGSLDGARDSISGYVDDSTSERLSDHARDTISRLDGAGASDLEILSSETVTLQQLQDAGIPVGSYQIDCDQPLHIVVMEGIFDRESLFETGATLAGGHAEGMAMRLVAQIYDPETENPLGMVGAGDSGSLGSIAGGGSVPDSGADGALVFKSQSNEESGALVPEAVCQ